MPHELAAIFGWISGHGNRLTVELLLEEDLQISFKDGAEENFCHMVL